MGSRHSAPPLSGPTSLYRRIWAKPRPVVPRRLPQLPHGYHRVCRGPRRTLAPPGKVPGSQGHLPDCVSPLSEGQGACSQASRGRSWEQASLEGSRSGSRVEWGGETSFTPQVLVSLPATMRSHTSPFSASTKHTLLWRIAQPACSTPLSEPRTPSRRPTGSGGPSLSVLTTSVSYPVGDVSPAR